METTCHGPTDLRLGRLLRALSPTMLSILVGDTRTVSLSACTFSEIFTAWATCDTGWGSLTSTLNFMFSDTLTGHTVQISARRYPKGVVLVFESCDQIQEYAMIHSLLHGPYQSGRFKHGLIRSFARGIAVRLRVALPADSAGTVAPTSASSDTKEDIC